MKNTLTNLITALCVIAGIACNAGEIRVITDRTESHLAPLFKYYEKTTGTKINPVYVSKGLISRLESRPTEADLVITKTVEVLEVAKTKKLLQPFSSKVLTKALKPEFKEKDNFYFIPSYRARAIYYSKDRVKVGELSTYSDLANPKWKGRIAIRSGYHNYNISLFSQMAASVGMEKTKEFIMGLHNNLARVPQGNDRAQVRAIYEGKADIAIGNSYYMGIMLSRDDQRKWAESANLFFPDQKGKGAYVLNSGAGLTKAECNTAEATKFLEFLVSDYAQHFMCEALYVYPCNTTLPMTEVNKNLGKEQAEVKDGVFKANHVSIAEASKYREAIISYLNEISFDKK